jgi:hypothetical protein
MQDSLETAPLNINVLALITTVIINKNQPFSIDAKEPVCHAFLYFKSIWLKQLIKKLIS